MCRLLALAALWLGCAGVNGQPLPVRIASLNVCTDQLLLLLVDPARITSLSLLASDSDYSNLAARAAAVPANRGQADELLSQQADLVLTSEFSGTLTARLLQRLGQRVERLGFATSVDEVWQQIRQVAAWTGGDASALIDPAAARVAVAQRRLREQLSGKTALFLSSNGVAFGAGTLQDDFLRSSGLRNLATEAGVTGAAPLALELLVAARPDYLIAEPRGALDRQLAHPLLLHPALARQPQQLLVLRDRWFDCAGPWIAEAYESLVAQVTLP
jgi:iron complex transport system substrate-binding protein